MITFYLSFAWFYVFFEHTRRLFFLKSSRSSIEHFPWTFKFKQRHLWLWLWKLKTAMLASLAFGSYINCRLHTVWTLRGARYKFLAELLFVRCSTAVQLMYNEGELCLTLLCKQKEQISFSSVFRNELQNVGNITNTSLQKFWRWGVKYFSARYTLLALV